MAKREDPCGNNIARGHILLASLGMVDLLRLATPLPREKCLSTNMNKKVDVVKVTKNEIGSKIQ